MSITKKIVPIRYTARDFNSIKLELTEYAKKYYPDTFKDFGEASFGALMLDWSAYIGDILSFYVDYGANEAHLKTSIEYNNILKHGYKLGYKHNPFQSSYGTVSIYCLVPSDTGGLSPNMDYAPIIKKGTVFAAGSKLFTLLENVDMNNASFSIRVAKTNSVTGVPTHYAIKGYGSVVSGLNKFQQTAISDFKRFQKIDINSTNVAEIVSVFDSEGNEYYEVDYLSQNIIYKSVLNKSEDAKMAPNILIPYSVPRRFIVENYDRKTTLVFGAASSVAIENDDFLPDPSNTMMEIYGKNYIKDPSFDPKKLVNSDKFGIGPSNTTLSIVYRLNTTENVNASAGSVDSIINLKADFKQANLLNSSLKNEVLNSFVVENEDPIVGSITIPDTEELKIRIIDNYATQGRAVTEKDYESMIYSMPAKFGAVKRIKAVKDIDSFKKNINLYVISEDQSGYLTAPSVNIKKNIKTWIEKSKSVSDTVDIIDAKIVNLKLNFTVIGTPDKSKSESLEACLVALRNYFKRKPEIGEPFLVNNILSVLKKVDGILDVRDVSISTANGLEYSRTPLQINTNMSMIGYNPIISMPLNVVWEIKYPTSDISGVIV